MTAQSQPTALVPMPHAMSLARTGPRATASRPLRIAQVSPLYEAVPPKLYGGTERIVAYLTDELVRRGHAVTLFASGDSTSQARLKAVVPTALRLGAAGQDTLAPHILELAQVFDRAHEFDVIHSHTGYVAFPFSRFSPGATVHTMHGRLDQPETFALHHHFRDEALVSISLDQRRPLDPFGVNWAGTVYHGLPLDQYAYAPRAGEYLAFLGRISPEKRPDLAIALAKQAGVPLRIAAKVDPVDREYFAREIEPLLDHRLVEFVGEIGEEDKPAFLGGARALVFPIDWPEPFGLVMIEALACGTPVIARRRGSVPEVIRHGRTGFIVESMADMVRAVRRLDRIDRAECRREAEARFSVERMADGYEVLYRRLSARARSA
jgi:glycosyltransferase involved in cell wall biosynthesis